MTKKDEMDELFAGSETPRHKPAQPKPDHKGPIVDPPERGPHPSHPIVEPPTNPPPPKPEHPIVVPTPEPPEPTPIPEQLAIFKPSPAPPEMARLRMLKEDEVIDTTPPTGLEYSEPAFDAMVAALKGRTEDNIPMSDPYWAYKNAYIISGV